MRTGDALPKRVAQVIETGITLVRETKGLGRGRRTGSSRLLHHPCAASISISADLPVPSDPIMVTVIGETISWSDVVAAHLLDVAIRMPRDADGSIRANGDHVKRRLEPAAVDEVADHADQERPIRYLHRAS